MPLVKSGSEKAFKDVTLAYVAGFFDGEGCVNFTQSGQYRTWVVRVMLRNTDYAVIQQIKNIFGGKIYSTTPKNVKWKISHCWVITGSPAVDFLRLISPFVMIKKDQISLAEVWQENRHRSNHNHEDGYRESMELLARQMKWLNRKGPRQSDDIEPMQEVLDTIPEDVKMEMRNALN